MTDETKAPHDEEAMDGPIEETDADIHDEISALHERITELKTQLAYALAEADNTRKRAERDVADARSYGVARFAGDMISVADNFERAMSSLTPAMRGEMGDSGRLLLTGVEMTQKELMAAFARHGVTVIASAPGDRFDPNLHQAAAQIPSEHEAGSIAAVVQSGWKIKDRILRAAMVAVSTGPVAAAPQEDGVDTRPGSRVDTKA
jgi:molecular chaperone GrpE